MRQGEYLVKNVLPEYIFDKRYTRNYIKFVKIIALYVISLFSHVYKVTKYQVCAEKTS